MIGKERAKELAEVAVKIYNIAKEYALSKGVIIADTKFEFGITNDNKLVLADEALTPDSSRFWPADKYEVGKTQESFDKQYLRDYLTSVGFDKKEGISLPEEVLRKTLQKYVEIYKILCGSDPKF